MTLVFLLLCLYTFETIGVNICERTAKSGAAPGLCVRGAEPGVVGGRALSPPEAVGFCMLSVSQNPLKSTIIIRNLI